MEKRFNDVLVHISAFLDMANLVKLRKLNKENNQIMTSTHFWTCASVLQEKRHQLGKRLFLFNQYLLSREQAELLAESKHYK